MILLGLVLAILLVTGAWVWLKAAWLLIRR
jgi:hypothetical protein